MPDTLAAPQPSRPAPTPRGAPAAPPTPKTAKDTTPRLRWLDLGGATLLVLAAAFAVSAGMTGPLRLLLALPLLLFAPGYLLLQAAVVPPARGAALARQCLAALGLSPALVGLFALSTAIVAGAFKAGVIVVLVTIGSLTLAVVALQRRRARVRALLPESRRVATAAPAASTRPNPPVLATSQPEAARAKTGTVRP